MMLAVQKITDCSAINIGTAEHIRIRQVAEQIFDYTGFRPEKLDFDLTKPVGVFSRAADLTQARGRLGWEPQTRFSDGLGRTIDWYFATHDREIVANGLATMLTER
jgi:nucleoside-diphosphate-sugar epimerase